jgi:hypothetical protein
MKNKVLYYILAFTWGLPMTLIGLFVALVLICLRYRANTYGGCLHFSVGKKWGGVSLGIVIITDDNTPKRTMNHEFGHSLQNCCYGFLMPFIVCIPSVIRYWYRELRYHRRNIIPPTAYDDIWFEGQATRWGDEMIQYFTER